jgi:DNA-binding response OmpR family regulator
MKTKIMIVDDEPDFTELIKKQLQKAGHEAVEAHNGNECLEKINEGFDMILLDVMMPDMNGFEVCKRIKDEPKTKDIPVIMLSVKGEEKDVIKGMSMGAVDYFPKPFSFDVLLAKINSILKTKKTEKEMERVIIRGLDREIRILTLKEQMKVLESKLKNARSGSQKEETPKKKVTKAKPEKKKAPAKKKTAK